MDREISFVLPGNPVAWHRTQQGRFGRYKDPKDTSFQNQIGQVAAQAVRACPAWDLRAQKFTMAVEFWLPDNRRRDLDNLLKNVMDALTGIVYLDDARVVRCMVAKEVDALCPRTVGRVWCHGSHGSTG